MAKVAIRFETAQAVKKHLKEAGYVATVRVRGHRSPFTGSPFYTVIPEIPTKAGVVSAGDKNGTTWGTLDPKNPDSVLSVEILNKLQGLLEGTNASAGVR